MSAFISSHLTLKMSEQPPFVTLLFRTMQKHPFCCFVSCLAFLCPFNEVKQSFHQHKSQPMLFYSRYESPRETLSRLSVPSSGCASERTGLRFGELCPEKKLKWWLKVIRRMLLVVEKHGVIFRTLSWLSVFWWDYSKIALNVKPSLQTGGFTNSEFSRGFQLCKHTNTRRLRTPATNPC